MDGRKRIRGRMMFFLFVVSVLILVPSAYAEVIYCDNCTDCSQKIQGASAGDIIRLTADVINQDGNCIEFNGVDGVTFDCDGSVISGDGDTTGNGIYLDNAGDGSNHNVVKNCAISRFDAGIKIYNSQNNTVTGTTIVDNRYCGVYLNYADNNNLINVSNEGANYGVRMRYSNYNTLINVTVRDNLKTSSWGGLYVERSNYNSFTDIVASNNTKYGIYIYWTSNYNRIRNATITTNDAQGGLYVYSSSGQSIRNDIDTSNTINGKPIQFFDSYYKSCPNDQVLDYNNTYSFIHFYNCNNITLYATTIEDSVFLWSTHNSKIYDVNASHGQEGIRIWQSSSNTFTNIITSHNANSGFYIDTVSNYNKFINITSSYNSNGVYANTANNNVFTNVIATNNDDDGFYMRHSDFNTFNNVTASNNGDDGIEFIFNSDYNTIKDSRIKNNVQVGLELYGSSSIDPEYNTIYNSIINNTFNMKIDSGTLNPNYLNTSLNCSGSVNIIGGPCTGGNFWAHPNGTGFSETCTDVDSDGFCDSSYTIEANNIDYLPLSLEYITPPAVYNISLFVGWNLISTPLEPVNTSIEVVLGGLTTPIRVFAYDASLSELDRWTYYSSEAIHPSMNSLNEINAGSAYWLHITVNETLTVTGMLPEPKDISIYSGWNFVGYNWDMMNTSLAVSQLTSPTRIFAYDASLSELERWTYYSSEALHPSMNSLKVMSPGRGYWLHSENNETWSVA